MGENLMRNQNAYYEYQQQQQQQPKQWRAREQDGAAAPAPATPVRDQLQVPPVSAGPFSTRPVPKPVRGSARRQRWREREVCSSPLHLWWIVRRAAVSHLSI